MLEKQKVIPLTIKFLILGLLIWLIIPFVFTSKNLISKNADECIYYELKLLDYGDLLNPLTVKNSEEKEIEKVINNFLKRLTNHKAIILNNFNLRLIN